MAHLFFWKKVKVRFDCGKPNFNPCFAFLKNWKWCRDQEGNIPAFTCPPLFAAKQSVRTAPTIPPSSTRKSCLPNKFCTIFKQGSSNNSSCNHCPFLRLCSLLDILSDIIHWHKTSHILEISLHELWQNFPHSWHLRYEGGSGFKTWRGKVENGFGCLFLFLAPNYLSGRSNKSLSVSARLKLSTNFEVLRNTSGILIQFPFSRHEIGKKKMCSVYKTPSIRADSRKRTEEWFPSSIFPKFYISIFLYREGWGR